MSSPPSRSWSFGDLLRELSKETRGELTQDLEGSAHEAALHMLTVCQRAWDCPLGVLEARAARRRMEKE